MKLGPMTIQVEVSREPCQCGTAPTRATIPVALSLSSGRMFPTGLVCDLAIDVEHAERDAVKALACKRCEL